MAFLAPIIPALIGAGGAVGSALIGRGQAGRIAKTQEQLAMEQAAATRPAIDYFTSLLNGNPAAVSQALSPEILATNKQFDLARQRLINSAPARGGALGTALGNIEAGRAFNLSSLLASSRQNAAQALLGGAPGLTGAGSILSSSYYNATAADEAARQRAQGLGQVFAQIVDIFRSGQGGTPSALPRSSGASLPQVPYGIFTRPATQIPVGFGNIPGTKLPQY